jgi:large subunit ribosomal protein L22
VSTVQELREVQAQAKWVRSSARKARLVTDQIRGRTVPEARTILAFSQRAIAREVEKVLNSAVANAESRPDLLLNGDDLVVAAAYADEGPTMKRWRARARGRVARVRKRTCHITVRLAELPQAGLDGKRPQRPEPSADAGEAEPLEAPANNEAGEESEE